MTNASNQTEPTTDPIAQPATDPKADPKEPTQGAAPLEPTALLDKHGQAGISRGKYEREIAERDARIKKLEEQVEKAAKDEEARAALVADIASLKAGIADERQEWELERAGCKDVESAKAVIDNYKGDVSALKEAKPWLFESKPVGSTGLKPAGPTTDDLDAKLDKAFGLA